MAIDELVDRPMPMSAPASRECIGHISKAEAK
jgi:hypothetical protein